MDPVRRALSGDAKAGRGSMTEGERSVRAVLDTVADIYAAPGDLGGWRRALGSVSHLVGGAGAVYMLINERDRSNDVAAFHGFRDEHLHLYDGAAGQAKDIRFRYLHNLVPGQAFRDFEFVPDRQAYDNAKWTRWALEHYGLYWCMSAVVSTHGLWMDCISVNRLKARGPHTDREKSDLNLLLPHLARAAELHRALTGLQRRYGAVLSVLDCLLVGMVILDRDRRVVVANQAASEVCESSGAMRLARSGHLAARRPEDDAALQRLVSKAIQAATADGGSDGGQLAIPGSGAGIIAEVVPFRDDGLPDREGVCGAAVFLMDTALSQLVSLDAIARIFRLTPAERGVAGALVNGLTVRDIADQRQSAVETVRKQLKSVFDKTGANSQLALLRLAVKATPPIRKRGPGHRAG